MVSPDLKWLLDKDLPSGPVIRWIGSESQPVPVRVPNDAKVDSWRWTSPDAVMGECTDKTVLLFAAKDGSLISKIDSVECVFWNNPGKPDGAPFVARSTQDGIWVLALPSGKELFRMREGSESVVFVDRVYGSEKFFTMDDRDVIRIWDVGRQTLVAKLAACADGRPTSVMEDGGLWMTMYQEEDWTQTEAVVWDKRSSAVLVSNKYALGSSQPVQVAMEEGLFAVGNRDERGWELFRLRRPAFWYGFLWLPDLYLTLALALGLGWSLWRDRKL